MEGERPDLPDLPPLSDIDLEVRRRRYREARRAGLTIAESELFAGSEIDVGELRQLVASGCPAGLIASVLL